MTETSAPASFAQRALWAVAQRNRGAALNVMILPWRIRGGLDVRVLEAALQDVVTRHQTLRSLLSLSAGQLLQTVLATEPISLQFSIVAGSSREACFEAAIEMLRDEGQQPIDLTAGSPIRLRLLQLGKTDHMFCLYVHHAMCDGWSSQIIMQDLLTFYDARRQGRAAAPAELAMQYAEFAQSQIRMHENGEYSQEIEYWRKQLEDLPPPVELPAIGSRKGNRDWRAQSPVHRESIDTLADLRRLARSRKSSLFSVLLATVAVMLHHRTGVEDLLIGVSTVNRRSKAEMQFVGCVTNLLPARIRLTGDLAFCTLVDQVQATVRRLLAYGRVPLELILRELVGPLSSGPVFPVWCQLREPSQAVVLDPGGLSFEPFQIDRAAVLCDLEVDVIETASGLDCIFAHRQSLFDPRMISGLMADFGAILQLAVREDTLCISSLCKRTCIVE